MTPERAVELVRELLEIGKATNLTNSFMRSAKKFSKTPVPELVRHINAGDQDAYAYPCIKIANVLTGNDDSVPQDLRWYAADILRDVGKKVLASPGKGRPVDLSRNLRVVSALKMLKSVGISPTVNPATREKSDGVRSGCEIVAEILRSDGEDIGESGVAKIWKDRRFWELS